MNNPFGAHEAELNHIVKHDTYITEINNIMCLCKQYDGEPYGGSKYNLFISGFRFSSGIPATCPRCIDIQNKINVGLPSNSV